MAYLTVNNQLAVEFRDGTCVEYLGTTEAHFELFLVTASHGTWIWDHFIRPFDPKWSSKKGKGHTWPYVPAAPGCQKVIAGAAAGALQGALTATAAGNVAAAGGPPCSTSNTYTATVTGSSVSDGVYSMTNFGGQSWGGSSGGTIATLDLSTAPYTLSFQFGFLGPTSTYTSASFNCATGATFTFVSESGGEFWPASVPVTSP
jgi:hypothetical protein